MDALLGADRGLRFAASDLLLTQLVEVHGPLNGTTHNAATSNGGLIGKAALSKGGVQAWAQKCAHRLRAGTDYISVLSVTTT